MKRTWILLAILTILAITLAVTQKNTDEEISPALNADETASPAPTLAYLFPGEEGVVTSLLIESREGDTIGFERQGEVWVATTPFHAETTPGAVEAAASQVTALPIEKSLDLNPSDVGLDSPAYTITVGFTSGASIVVAVGDKTPTENGYYVRKDDGSVLVVSSYSLDSLLGLLKTPPLVETPTPTPAPPTETPTITATPAVTESGATPAVTKTP
ncbi:MAG: hypothetical protein HFACDABA_02717 [Anaerolineales bacterium]|nr:hypothetical protein [Anaerolineales bacterium]